LLASVDVIAQEEVVCFWREPAIFEQTEEVIVLAVDVTTDLRRRSVSQGGPLGVTDSGCRVACIP
jgi:hypothetical protein